MKVIKHPDTFKTIKIDCKCTAVLEIEYSDIKRHYFSCQRDGTDDYAYVVCPCCSSWVIIKKSLIPTHLYEKLPLDINTFYWGH